LWTRHRSQRTGEVLGVLNLFERPLVFFEVPWQTHYSGVILLVRVVLPHFDTKIRDMAYVKAINSETTSQPCLTLLDCTEQRPSHGESGLSVGWSKEQVRVCRYSPVWVKPRSLADDAIDHLVTVQFQSKHDAVVSPA
jgi:hypothetical protein